MLPPDSGKTVLACAAQINSPIRELLGAATLPALWMRVEARAVIAKQGTPRERSIP